MHILLDRGGHDLRGREPDPLVDNLEADVPRTHRDLLRAVGVPVQTRLADQQLQAAAQLLAGLTDRIAYGRPCSLPLVLGLTDGDTGGRAVLTEHLA